MNGFTCEYLLAILTALAYGFDFSYGQSQAFRERPTNQTIAEGGAAFMNCAVNNMAGELQWAKDGALLGSDPNIPGYDSLQMTGNAALGEYHLVISNADITDDAMYECQVTPSSTGNHELLAASAYLNVIIPPQQPSITGHANGSTVEVPHTEKNLQLTCVSLRGKPAATIKWFRNDEEITDGIEYTVENADAKLRNARSVLTFAPNGDDNNAFYKCTAQNDALLKPYHTKVQLSVMHPPEQPEIRNFNKHRILKAGDTINPKCIARGGNPVARVYWYRDGKELDFMYHSEPNMAHNELVLTLQPSDNGAVLQCQVTNKVTLKPLIETIHLNVSFSPSEVTINGQEHGRLGEQISLSCVTAISNPPATISWRSQNDVIINEQSVVKSELGGYVTTSNHTVTLTHKFSRSRYECIATNSYLDEVTTAAIDLDIMYPPESLAITGYEAGAKVMAKNVQELTCKATGGNPPANVTWWKGKRHIQGVTHRISSDITKNTISFILKPDDNGALYRCKAHNLATDKPLKRDVRLAVNFPPDSLNITSDPAVVRAGQPLTLQCRSSSSNPQSQLSWWKDGVRIIDGDQGDRIVSAEWGGKSTISSLQLFPTHEYDQQIYACKATNELLQRAVSDGFTLDVLHVPTFSPDFPGTVDIVEGEAKVFNFTAKSNPPTVTYTWYKDGDVLTGGEAAKSTRRRRAVNIPHFMIEGGLLNITNITRADSGMFTIQAQNNEGGANFTFNMNVQYPASVASITSNTMFDTGRTAQLVCTADANPVIPNMVSWQRQGYDLTVDRVTKTSTDSSATLVITNVTKADTGQFLCEVSNGIGGKANATSYLIVKFAPEIDNSAALGKAAAADGGVAIMRCQAEGAPAISFKWKKGESGIDTTNSRFTEVTSKLTPIRYESSLSLHNVSKEDHGTYLCIATNVLGEDRREIVLDGTSRPDPPVGLQLVNVTHNSIALRWLPGFDGGSTQQFQIRYAVRDKDAFTYEMVTPPLATVYVIKGLQLGTEYDITVRGINSLGEGKFQPKPLNARTSAVAPISSKISSSDIPLLIILTVSIIGMLLLGFNILLILFFIRRRRRKMAKGSSSLSGTNSIEMYNSPTITEDSKSNSTYGRHSIQEFPEDFKPYEYQNHYNPSSFYSAMDDDEMKRFLPPNPTSAYDPYGSLKHGGLYGPAYVDPRSHSMPRDGGHNTMPHPQRRPLIRGPKEPIYEDNRPLQPTSTGWPSQHSVSPYSSLPPIPQDRVAPLIDNRADTPQDYAQKLRDLHQPPHRASMDRIPQQKQNVPPHPMTQPAPDQEIPPPVPRRSTLNIPDNYQHKKPSNPASPPGTGNMPPLPKRNYAADDVKPHERYTATPSRQPPQPDIQGHLV